MTEDIFKSYTESELIQVCAKHHELQSKEVIICVYSVGKKNIILGDYEIELLAKSSDKQLVRKTNNNIEYIEISVEDFVTLRKNKPSGVIVSFFDAADIAYNNDFKSIINKR